MQVCEAYVDAPVANPGIDRAGVAGGEGAGSMGLQRIECSGNCPHRGHSAGSQDGRPLPEQVAERRGKTLANHSGPPVVPAPHKPNDADNALKACPNAQKNLMPPAPSLTPMKEPAVEVT